MTSGAVTTLVSGQPNAAEALNKGFPPGTTGLDRPAGVAVHPTTSSVVVYEQGPLARLRVYYVPDGRSGITQVRCGWALLLGRMAVVVGGHLQRSVGARASLRLVGRPTLLFVCVARPGWELCS